jgi:hypothetical protein
MFQCYFNTVVDAKFLIGEVLTLNTKTNRPAGLSSTPNPEEAQPATVQLVAWVGGGPEGRGFDGWPASRRSQL